MDEKTKLEKSALIIFLEIYNRLNGTNLEFEKHCDRPDIIVKDRISKQELGIEVKHLPYDEDEAKILLGRSISPIHSLMSSAKLIEKLNNLLKEATETARKYEFKNKMFLIIRVASRIFDKQDFELHKEDIQIPPNIFSEIWLVFGTTSGTVRKGLMRLN
ncbi:hypothetical protein ACFLWM_00910 [Chloroflexota bacterium]